LEAYRQIYNNVEDESEDDINDTEESEEEKEEESEDKEENDNQDDIKQRNEEEDLEFLDNDDDLELNDMPSNDEEEYEETMDDDEELEKALKEIAGLLTKVRSISRLARKSNVIQIKVKTLIQQYGLRKINFILDFHVRWNSSYIMVQRFKKLQTVVQSLTDSNIEDIDGLTPALHSKLQTWSLNNSEWNTLGMLEEVLLPFFLATKLLSGRKYPTLPLNLYVYRNLKAFLSNNTLQNPKSKENFLKEHLLRALNYHFDEKISKEQHSISLVKKFTF
jgi:hypothetical protein